MRSDWYPFPQIRGALNRSYRSREHSRTSAVVSGHPVREPTDRHRLTIFVPVAALAPSCASLRSTPQHTDLEQLGLAAEPNTHTVSNARRLSYQIRIPGGASFFSLPLAQSRPVARDGGPVLLVCGARSPPIRPAFGGPRKVIPHVLASRPPSDRRLSTAARPGISSFLWRTVLHPPHPSLKHQGSRLDSAPGSHPGEGNSGELSPPPVQL